LTATSDDGKTGLHERIRIFGLPLDCGIDERDVINRISQGRLLITYLNPLAFRVTQEFPGYASNLDSYDLVVCDGIAIQKSVELVFNRTTPILSLDFSGIGHACLAHASCMRWSGCLVGGRPGVAIKAAEVISSKFPGVNNLLCYEGYGKSLEKAREEIIDVRPDFVLAGLGMGRQEPFLLSLAESGWQGVGICVGGFFDKIVNPELDYPEWSVRLGLRFLGRLAKEPRRMSKRYFVHYLPFMKLYVGYLLKRE